MKTMCWLGVLCSAACGETGSLEVTVSGEDAAESGYPVAAGDTTIGFVDGWTMTFDAVVVSLSDVELRGADGADALLESDPVLVDLHGGEVSAWSFEAVPARRWEDVRYRIAPASDASRDLGDVDPAIRARMIDRGWSLYLSGAATKGDLVRRIEWGLALDVRHSHCVGVDGTDGIIVGASSLDRMQITIHLDHFFFDSLGLDDAEMRFDAIAAVEADVPITFEMLGAQRLADMRGLDGAPLVNDEGELVLYDPGSTALPEPTLEAMVRALAATVGHINGEGHCVYGTP